ncbi:MAG TPA: hypothetical protein VK034_24790 [Enhygromyxa sp.]|nr:hypothetical protein [Enhygromyxa sp.]
MPHPLRIIIPPLVGMTAALALPNAADAREPKRSGGQVELVFGGSDCIPAAGECESDDGGSKPSGALGVDLGWRVHKLFFAGAGYSVGWLRPTWELNNQRLYQTAHQQGVFGVLRVYIPIWRIDIGLELSPGWSRQTFVAEAGDSRSYSQGFALRPGVSLDFRLGKRLFIGGRVDFILNFHQRMCTKLGDERSCSGQLQLDPDVLPVHQVIGGVHFGANF